MSKVDIHASFISLLKQIESSIPSGFAECSSLKNVNELSTSVNIPNNRCNSPVLTQFDLSALFLLESVVIGNENCMYCKVFRIDGLNLLKSIKIGNNSFTKKKNNYGNDDSRSFDILNCAELKSIEIGLFSFSDYGGGFELNNLPKLESIKIGEIGSNSYNFYGSSFVVKGIIDMMILLMNRSSIVKFY